MRLAEIPPTGAENYSCLQKVREQQKIQSFKHFSRWYKNKDSVPTLEAIQKVVEFFHNKGIDMLKLGCTLPNLANICLHSSTSAKFYPFTENQKRFALKFGKMWLEGRQKCLQIKMLSTRHICNSTNFCKLIVGINASQL